MSDERKFEDRPAVRESVPLLVGLVGPSGSGKTFSMLRLLTGFQQVGGGDNYVIDTEAARALHYADQFKFRHLAFGSPFSPLDYLAAVKHCVAKGAKNIGIDSTSHLWEGPGGVLEWHEAECVRLQQAWNSTREKVQMSAWQRPKQALRRFINEVLQLRVNLIFCFRAKEKLKITPGKQPQSLGWMPIAPEEMCYEMTLNCLLYPASGGVPSWHPSEMGEKAIIKLPQQFRGIFAQPQPLSEDIGRQLAEWARGGSAPAGDALLAAGRLAAQQGTHALQKWWEPLKPAEKKRLKAALDGELKALAAKADDPGEPPQRQPGEDDPEPANDQDNERSGQWNDTPDALAERR